MEPLPPIPVPTQVLWREFRLRVVPVIVFCAVVAAIVLLWSRLHTAQTLSGLGEGLRSMVTAPQPALLREILVRPYQLVNAGDPLAVLQPVDPRLPLDLLQAEVQLAGLRFQPSVAEQNAMNYERVRAELLRTRAELAIAKVNLERAENEVRRTTPLYQEKLISEDLWDLSVKTRDAFQAEVREKGKAAQEMETRLEQLRTLGDPQYSGTDDRLQRLLTRLDASQSAASSNSGPLTLRAPINGMVSAILRQPGEYVLDGEQILAVHSLWSERVVGYLRQPYTVDPEVGMPVQVTTRQQKRQQFQAQITQVGAQVEIITNALAFVRQGVLVDVGLPIIIDVPQQARIRPGEMVDIYVKPGRVNPLGPPVN